MVWLPLLAARPTAATLMLSGMPKDVQDALAAAVALGKLMGLVNCAGIAPAVKTVGKDGAHPLQSSPRRLPST